MVSKSSHSVFFSVSSFLLVTCSIGSKIGTSVTTGTQDSGELKKKFDIFQEKVKEIVKVLKDGVTSENQAVVQAIKDLEALTVTETVEPQAMEEVQPEETAAPQTEAQQTEAAETQGGQEEGQEREGETQTQTEAEAMQEALF